MNLVYAVSKAMIRNKSQLFQMLNFNQRNEKSKRKKLDITTLVCFSPSFLL